MASSPTNPIAKPAVHRSRRWLRRTVYLFIMAGIVWLAMPSILSWIISYKLRVEIADRLNATLVIDKLTYFWPYGVRIENARLTANSATKTATPLLDVGRLELELANLPIGDGPLVIKKVDIRDPLVYLIKKPKGVSGSSLFNETEPSAGGKKKLSDLFELRQLTISNGRVQYDDRSKSQPVPPLVWSGLQADLRTTQQGPSKYQFQFTAKQAPLAVVNADGSADIDGLLLDVAHLSVAVQARADQRAEQLPPQIQAICEKFHIAGQITLNAVAHIPLNQPDHGVYAAELKLDQGCCRLPGWTAAIMPVQLSLTCSNGQGSIPTTLPTTLSAWSPDLRLQLSTLKIISGKQTFELQSGEGRINRIDGTWAIGHIAGTTELGDDRGSVQSVGISTHLPFAASGHGILNTGEFLIRLDIEDANAKLPPGKMQLDQIAAKLNINRDGLILTQLTANIFGGQATLNGNLAWDDPTHGVTYAGRLSAAQIDARQASNHFMSNQNIRDKASGVGELTVAFQGGFPQQGSAADAFAANGNVDVRHGHFLEVPVLKDVMAEVKNADAATVGEVGATFSIAHRNVHFQRAAANAPAVGVLGKGDLGFDGMVDMGFIVTPLADWREKLESTDVPILNTIGAIILGDTQKVLNSAARTILYQYRVIGPITHVKTETVPAPVLTDEIRKLFEEMSRGNGFPPEPGQSPGSAPAPRPK